MGQELVSTRPELLHVGVFAIFTKADVGFIRGGFGYHNCRSLVGKASPVELGGRQGHRWSQHIGVLNPGLHPFVPSPGDWVFLGGTAAGGKETDATQNGEQGGTPAQVEGGTQLIPGGVEEVRASPEGLGRDLPTPCPQGQGPSLTWFQHTRG